MCAFIPQVAPVIDENEVQAVVAYLRSGGWLTEFERTEQFEKMIAEASGTKYCSVVTNGTITLVLALQAIGLKPGDEVIVPDLTMIASPNAVRLVGGTPVLCDIDPRTLCATAKTIDAVRTKRTRAVMLVSLNARFPNDIAEIQELCKRHDIVLIEDAAQSLGSTFANKKIGSYGAIGSFSFSPHKIVTTGQGGALVTNDEGLYRAVERLKDFGRDVPGKDIHPFLGWNYKFTDVLAVIGIEQMKKLPARVVRKREIYDRYQQALKGTRAEFLPTDLTQTAPWFVDVFVDNPEALGAALKKDGIGTRPIYPPVHSQPIYADADASKLAVTTRMCARGLWLPSSVDLTNEKIDEICGRVREHLA